MSRLFLALPICLLLLMSVPGQSTSEIDKFLTKIATEKGFSGVVLVAKDGKILLEKGYGFANQGKTSVTRGDTKYFIASITKQFTAAAILKLEEMGRLSVEDPIGKYLKNVPNDRGLIKIHHLLSQSSGIGQNYAADGIVNRESAIEAIFKWPLIHTAGERFTYSNDNYSLLAMIVETASGKTYEDFLKATFFAPLEMSNTGFWGETNVDTVAEMMKRPNRSLLKRNWGFVGCTGLNSTAGDLYKWQQALFADNVLSRSSRKKMHAAYFQMSRGMHGYGWFTNEPDGGPKSIWTSGAEDNGHNGIIKVFQDGTVLIVLSNSGEISGELSRTVAAEGIDLILFK